MYLYNIYFVIQMKMLYYTVVNSSFSHTMFACFIFIFIFLALWKKFLNYADYSTTRLVKYFIFIFFILLKNVLFKIVMGTTC